jgi:phosphonate transport system substrate-binding protein
MTQPTLIFGTFLAPALYKTCLYITEHVERSVGIPTFLLPGEELDDFADGALDAGFISGLAYVHMTNQQPSPVEPIAAPVLQGIHDQHTPYALSDIVVRKDSGLSTVEDLRGCAWATCIPVQHEKISQAEYSLMYEAFFEQMPFKNRKVTRSHAQSLRLVLDGRVDAAAIDSHLLDIVFDQSPKMATQLRIVGTFSASTMPPVVVSSRVDPLLTQRIQAACLDIHQNPFFAHRLQEGSIERFLPVTDEHYQDVRERYKGMQANAIPGKAVQENMEQAHQSETASSMPMNILSLEHGMRER